MFGIFYELLDLLSNKRNDIKVAAFTEINDMTALSNTGSNMQGKFYLQGPKASAVVNIHLGRLRFSRFNEA